MRYRAFGTTGLSVSEIGVGCSRIGGLFSSGSSPADELRMLQQAIDAGINFFDTADLYSHGQSEILVGKAVKSRRSEVIVATKGGYVLPAQSRLLGRIKPMLRPVIKAVGLKRPTGGSGGPAGAAAQDFTPEYLAAAVEGSLKRLGTDHIDIYQLHSPPRTVVEAGEYIGVLEGLKQQGKIRHFGIAADSAADAAGFEPHSGITSLEVPFSIVEQEAALELLPTAASRGVGVISRSCFAAGLLVGDLPEERLRELTPDWKAMLAFRATAAQLGRPRKELALQFSLGTDTIAVTLLGMQTPAQLDEILRLYATPALSQQELAALA